MQDFTLYAPTKIYFGDHLDELGSILKGYGFRKPLVYYGSGHVKKTGLLDRITGLLDAAGIAYETMGGVQANPRLDFCRETVAFLKKSGCDLILAVGGGSVLDSAKMAAHCVRNDHDPWDYTMKTYEPENSLPVASVLTIAASGSETSASAVLTNTETGVKKGLNCDENRPLFALMDPRLTYTLPPYQTACGIVDILMHSFDRYMCYNENNALADEWAEGLCRAVIAAGRTAMEKPDDYEARATLMLAGSFSHNGLTGVGRDYAMLVHALEHELSALDESIAHGAGLAVLWPNYLQWLWNRGLAHERIERMAQNVWHAPDGPAGIEACRAYFKSLGMPATLGELGLGEENIAYLARHVCHNGAAPLRSYVPLGVSEAEEIYRLCL